MVDKLEKIEKSNKPDKEFKNKKEKNKEKKPDQIQNKPKERMVEFSEDIDLEYLLILDFEATCFDEAKIDQDNQKLEVFEIIEFPILALNTKTYNIDFKFHHYIKPTVHPKLNKFCTELTGITQETVDKGISLEESFKLLFNFMKESGLDQKHHAFVTCGDWDFMTCIRNECKYKNIEYPDYLKRWVNIKKCFKEYKNDPKVKTGMTGMLDEFGLKLEGRHHSGIDDCYNISKVAIALLQKGIKFNKYMSAFRLPIAPLKSVI
jgi:ERI1 exoribonuclease 3